MTTPTPPTSTKWVPMGTIAKVFTPTPVVGKWAYGSGGAMVWQDIPYLDPAPDTDWKVIGVDIAFENGWGNWPDANYTPCRFRKLNDGLVVLEGLMTGGAGSAPCFTMPPGYRPSNNVASTRISHWLLGSSFVPANHHYWMYSDGRLIPSDAGAGNYFSLCGMMWYADH